MEATKKEHELIVSVSPHVKSEETTSRIMWTVSLALLPALLSGVYFFGLKALFITALCIISSLVSEQLYMKMVGKKSPVGDGSAFLTGLLLGMNMPASLWSFSPFTAHVPIIASFVAVVITKQLFGGLGFNVFNPALIGRAFALISWPRAMTIWMEPTASVSCYGCKDDGHPSWDNERGGHDGADKGVWRQKQPLSRICLPETGQAQSARHLQSPY